MYSCKKREEGEGGEDKVNVEVSAVDKMRAAYDVSVLNGAVRVELEALVGTRGEAEVNEVVLSAVIVVAVEEEGQQRVAVGD